MSQNRETSVQLKQNQLDYLDEMARKYALPDRDKALRCLIVYAMEKADQEESIFNEIRCTNC